MRQIRTNPKINPSSAELSSRRRKMKRVKKKRKIEEK